MKYIINFLILAVMPIIILAQDSQYIFTYKVGNIEVSLLNEAQNQGNSKILIGATPEMLKNTIPEGIYPSAVNTFLIKTSDKNILVDTGFGKKLFENLHFFGINPEDIDIVLLTHMHGDHIGGMFMNGEKAFPEAKVYLSQIEYQYWNNEAKNNEQARKVFLLYKDQIVLFDPISLDKESDSLFPEIKAVRAYGHTPGHTMFLIESKKEKLLIWGDLAHALAVQMPYPEVAVTYDVNPEDAILSRITTLKYVAQNRIPVTGMHIPYPGVGKVIMDNNSGYVFVPFDEDSIDK